MEHHELGSLHRGPVFAKSHFARFNFASGASLREMLCCATPLLNSGFYSSKWYCGDACLTNLLQERVDGLLDENFDLLEKNAKLQEQNENKQFIS